MPRNIDAVRSFALKYANAAMAAVRAKDLPIVPGMRKAAYQEGLRRAEAECQVCNVSQGVADEAVALLEELLSLSAAELEARRRKLSE